MFYRHSEILVAVTLLAVSNLTKDFFAKGRGLPWEEREGAKKSSYFFDGTERLIATLDNILGNFTLLNHVLNLGNLSP